ncbi:MAG: glycine/sarcosine/betaine reductase selenoprotein B family protein [Thermoanaerobaculia bacterium]
MGSLDEFSWKMSLFLRTYRWRVVDPVPWIALRLPLSRARVAIVSSAGFVLPGQKPFDDSVKGGDWSFREIPAATDPHLLMETHRSRSFDHSGIREEPDLAFPLETLHELAQEGSIGAVAPRHVSMMGSITAPGRMLRETAPRVTELLHTDSVDAVLLVPV